jgi:signal transduction histidine kinase
LGVSYEPALLEALVDDLDRGGIEPPQLQVVCNRLFEERRGDTILLSDYERLGRAGGILAAHLALFMERLGRKRPTAEKVLTELINAEGTKRTLGQEELEAQIDAEALDDVLERLVDARLLRRDEYAGVFQYELAHECLIKDIHEWISDEQMRIKEVRELLDREVSNWRIFGTLISPDRLKIIEKRCGVDEQLHLTQEARELIERSRKEQVLAEQEQLHIIHAAKMASLDQLVLGIGHEISSPIACISSDSQFLRGSVAEMKRILDQLPGLLVELSQNEGDWPTLGQDRDEDIEESLRARLGQYLEALSLHIDGRIREGGLWATLDEVDQISDELQQAADKMTGLVKALSGLVQPDQAVLKPTDVHVGLDTALLLLGYELKYNVRVRCDYTEGTLRVKGSPGQLVQLFMNVLMNSADAIKIRKAEGLDGGGMIEVKTYRDGSWGVVEISDDGHGIPQENLERIFEPGFTTRGPSHRGLGLSIAHQIVQRHSGLVEAKSELHKGTTLTIKLPLADVGEGNG